MPGLCLPSWNLCCPCPKSCVQVRFTSLKLPFRAVDLQTLSEIMSETEREWVHHRLIFGAFLTGHSVFVGVKSCSLWPDVSAWHSAPSCRVHPRRLLLSPSCHPVASSLCLTPQCFLGRHVLQLSPFQEATETVFRDSSSDEWLRRYILSCCHVGGQQLAATDVHSTYSWQLPRTLRSAPESNLTKFKGQKVSKCHHLCHRVYVQLTDKC